MNQQHFGAYRYPASGAAIADGENFIEKALGVGKKARQVVITVIGKNAKVVINGELRTPESSYGSENGPISNYFHRHVGTCLTDSGRKEYGSIESAIVSGDGVTFYAEIST